MTTQVAHGRRGEPPAPPAPNKWGFSPRTAGILQSIGFTPTGPAQAAIFRCRKQFKLVVGGGQAGKSIQASADYFIHLFEDAAKKPGKPLLYWLVAADYDRTRGEVTHISRFLGKQGISFVPPKRVDPGHIEFVHRGTPVRLETKSGKDPRTLSMFSPDGIIGCEASQLDLDTYQKLLERVTPSGGWLHLSGTYEGSLGWYPGLAKAWEFGTAEEQSFKLPAPTNTYFYPLGMNDPKLLLLRKNTSDQFFLEKIMGEAMPPKGMVFSEFRPDIHIRDIEYDPNLPVYISDDPGYGHAHAIEVWQIAAGGQIRVFDEIYKRGVVTQDLIQTCIKREWWKNENKTLVIDPNYASQHAATHSVAEIWLAESGLTPSVGQKVKIYEGTERLRTFLKVDALSGQPGIIFNGKLRPDEHTGAMNPTCHGVLSELGAYPSPFDGQTRVYSYKLDREGNVMGDTPDDKYNDGCKALIYGIVEHFGLTTTESSAFFVTKTYSTGKDSRRERRSMFR